jgi:MFS family permease
VSAPNTQNAMEARVSEETWSLVADNIAGRPRPKVRMNRQRWALVVVAGAGLCLVLGFILGGVVGAQIDDLTGEMRSGWPSTVGTVLLAAALVAWGIGFVRYLRQGAPRAWSTPTSGVPRRERQWIDRMIRGRAAFPDEHVDELRSTAVNRLQQSAVTVMLAPGFVLLWAANLFDHEWAPSSLLQVIASVFFVTVLALTLRYRKQWRAFLQETEPRAGAELTSAS